MSGRRGNRDAIGAKVSVKTRRGEQVKGVVSGEGFLSDSDKRLLFGLAEQMTVDAVVITWPDGHRQAVAIDAIDRYWLIVEDGEPVALTHDAHIPS